MTDRQSISPHKISRLSSRKVTRKSTSYYILSWCITKFSQLMLKETYRNKGREFIPSTRDWTDWIDGDPCYWNQRLKQISFAYHILNLLLFFGNCCLLGVPQPAEIVLNLATFRCLITVKLHTNHSDHSNFELRVLSIYNVDIFGWP